MSNDLKEKLEKVDQGIASLTKDKSPKKKDGLSGERVLGELIAGILFGVFVGLFLDNHFNTKPLFLISLIILGLAGSFYNIYKSVSKVDNDNNK